MSDDLDPASRCFGENPIRVEPPDVVFVVAVGEVTPAQASVKDAVAFAGVGVLIGVR
jgi:hypothetical protein